MNPKFTKTEEKVSAEVLKETTSMIAKELNESAIERLRAVVAYLGPQVAQEVMQETLNIEEQGGMLIQDGSRRRTPGGIFFYLVKQGVSKKGRRKLFPYTRNNRNKLWPKRRRKSAAAKANGVVASRERGPRVKYEPALKTLLKSQEFGIAESMNVKLIGRPGKIVEQDSFVITIMQMSQEWPSISKDLPKIPDTNLRLLVYMTKKQWDDVVPGLLQPENSLNISGILTYDDRLRRMVVFARAVTVKVGQPTVNQGKPRSTPDAEAEATSDATSNAINQAIDSSDVEQAALELLVSDKEEAVNEEISLEREFEEDEIEEDEFEADRFHIEWEL